MYGEAVGAFALICGNDPLRGDLIRRFAPPVHLAVPENPIGLALILGIFDRCGNCRLSFSAAGSESLQFSRRGKHSGLSGMPAPTYRPGCIPGKSKRGSQAPFGRLNEGGSREGEKTKSSPPWCRFLWYLSFGQAKERYIPYAQLRSFDSPCGLAQDDKRRSDLGIAPYAQGDGGWAASCSHKKRSLKRLASRIFFLLEEAYCSFSR